MTKRVLITLLIAAVALSLLAAIPSMRPTRLSAIHLSCDTCGTATPVLRANGQSTGKLFEAVDNGTPVFSIDDGGAARANQLNFVATNYTSTGAQTITPTNRTLYNLNPTAVLTITLGTGEATTGDMVIFANNVTTSTVIVDTGATAGGSNVTLGENDNAGFIFLGDAWIELFSPDNS